MKGTIKAWSARGFGFIQPSDGGPDIYVHIEEIDDGVDELRAGQQVHYTPGINPRNGKREAKDVRLIE